MDNSDKQISYTESLYIYLPGLVLLCVCGYVFLEVLKAIFEKCVDKKTTRLLAGFSLILTGFGVGLTGVGYKRLSDTEWPRSQRPFANWLLYLIGVLFIVGGIYGIIAGDLIWGVSTLILGGLVIQQTSSRRAKLNE